MADPWMPRRPRGFGSAPDARLVRESTLASAVSARLRIGARAASSLIAFVVMVWLDPAPAFAQVTTSDDTIPSTAGSLRSEVEASASGGTIAVQIGTASSQQADIPLAGTLVFDNSVTIDNSVTTFGPVGITAPDAGNFFEIQSGVDVILRDLGLTNNGTNNGDAIDLMDATSRLTFDLERGDQTVSVDLIGAGALVKEGGSALALTGQNSFSGGLTIRQGDVSGDLVALNTSIIDLAPDASSKTARVVFDINGSSVLGAMGSMITDNSTNGGIARFVKSGSGTLDITGANIAGSIGIDVEQGDLIVDAPNIDNNHNFNISSGAMLRFKPGFAAPSHSGSISGSGVLRTEADTLILNGDLSAFTGTLDVNLGPIFGFGVVTINQVTPPAGPLAFDVALNGTMSSLVLNDTANVILTGNISGTGDLIKNGTGTTTLTGTSTFTGGTTVGAGTLIGNTNSLQRTISVLNGATLGFDQANAGTFSGDITSPVDTMTMTITPITVRKFGGGTLTLATTQNFTGDLNVEAGGLFFAQGVDLTAANLTIGTGSGLTTSFLGASFDPTDGADNTIMIGGDLTIASDAQVTVDLSELMGSGRNTVLAAGGNVTIDPAAELIVRLQPGIYAPMAGIGPRFNIITGNMVAGGFDIQQNNFFFNITGDVVGMNIYRLTLNPSGNQLADVATTSNQVSVGGPLDQLRMPTPGADAELLAFQQALNVAQVSEIDLLLEAASPDDLAATTNVQLAASSRTWRSLSNRLALQRRQSIGHHNTRQHRLSKARRERARRLENPKRRKRRPSVDAGSESSLTTPSTPEKKPWVAWFEGSGAIGTLDSTSSKAYDYRMVGPLIGADSALTQSIRIGFAVGSTRARYDVRKRLDNKGVATSVEGVVYASYVGGPVDVLIGARYAHSWAKTDRYIRFGTIASRIEGDYQGNHYGAYAELTRGFALPLDIEIAPLASVAYSRVTWNGFNEDGTSPLRMRVDSRDTDSAMTSLGLRVSTEREMEGGLIIKPRFKAVWNHEWADIEREISGRFGSSTLTSGSQFRVDGAEIPRDHAELSLGWEVGFREYANLFIDWNGRYGQDLVENSLSAGVRVAW